ncbi:MAG: DUF2510 domain-containing protein [Solirubrobacterales bacterium]
MTEPASAHPQALPPARWYPDPSGSGTQRYWDGSRWAEEAPPATPAGWYDYEGRNRYWDGAQWTVWEETAPAATPAGWYKDPQDPTTRRYWDGVQWTDSRAPLETDSGPRNGMAVTAFVLGLIGALIGLIIAVFAYPVPLCLGLAAVPLGIIARVRAGRPGVGRKGMATWGMVLGLLSITWGIVGAVAFNNAVNDLNHSLSSHCLNHPSAPDC